MYSDFILEGNQSRFFHPDPFMYSNFPCPRECDTCDLLNNNSQSSEARYFDLSLSNSAQPSKEPDSVL